MSDSRQMHWIPAGTMLVFVLLAGPAWAQTVTVQLDDNVVAPRALVGIGVNGGGSWYNFVGAILVDDPSFEGPADQNGFARRGWPWYASGSATGAVESSGCPTGNQCQRVDVAAAPASINQGRTDLPQAPLVMPARPGHTYRIKLRIRASLDGARVKLGLLDDGWSGRYGTEITVGTSWQVIESTYSPSEQFLLRGVSIRFEDAGSFWLDDVVAWDEDDIDPATGLSATFVARLEELRPATLRLGGLGVNGIPLESYLRRPWDLDYGPPGLQPDLDLVTFLRLCLRVGAQPFITVPPAFSDDTHWQVGDLTYEVLDSVYQDHGNLVDYLGGDAATAYGARREADGFSRWDNQFERIYFELGNELWGTPDDTWDMDINGDENLPQQMQNFVTYNQRRMTEMKARPGWRGNMRVGFCGRSPDTWIGGWPGSYDGTVVPAIGALTDFSTIDMYYGTGSASDPDSAIYAALFATAEWHRREITTMRAAFREAAGGKDIATTVYEGNATWGGYEPDLHDPSPLYFKSVSLGAALSLVDNYAAANAAGVENINHFHYGGNVWGATGPYPEVLRKPAFFALQLLTREVRGDMIGCSVSGAGSYDDQLTGESAVPYLACYPYREGDDYALLLVNRHLTQSRNVAIQRRLVPLEAVWLEGDLGANNETAENVSLRRETLSGVAAEPVTITLPAHSAVVLKLRTPGAIEPDGGSDGGADAGSDGGADAGGDAGPDAGADAGVDAGGDAGADPGADDTADAGDGDTPDGGADQPGGSVSGSCACGGGPARAAVWLPLLFMLAWRRRRQA